MCVYYTVQYDVGGNHNLGRSVVKSEMLTNFAVAEDGHCVVIFTPVVILG